MVIIPVSFQEISVRRFRLTVLRLIRVTIRIVFDVMLTKYHSHHQHFAQNLITEGNLRNVSRSDNNPHGFLIERWNTIENKDLAVENRK